MKNTVLIPQVYLHTLNAFDIGNNLAHINHGLIQSTFTQKVTQHALSLSTTDYITLSGHAIELLDEESPEMLTQISSLLSQDSTQLIAALYYNTSLSLLSSKNFLKQWDATNHLFEKHFSKRSKKLYIGNQTIPKQLSNTIRDLDVEIVGNSALNMVSVPLGERSSKEIDLSVGLHSSFMPPSSLTDLNEHISNELLALEPFIATDEKLSTTWQHLANHTLLSQLDGSNPQSTYETYFTYMNILNDVAHTIRNVELTKQGEFETTAQIVDEPSKRVLEVMNNEVNL